MSTSSPPAATGGRTYWQQCLFELCVREKLQYPAFSIVSDRRGGRTAWSSTVTIQGSIIAARYWYDGDYINNAKEDAAEVAVKQINPQIHRTACSGQIFPPSGYGGMCSWNNHQ